MTLVNAFTAVVRSFRRAPGFSAAVVLTLALGIAPNVVIFAIMDGVYFRPLPYPAQERLALVNVSHPSTAALDQADAFTFLYWREHSTTFESLAVYSVQPVSLEVGERTERVTAQAVSAGFFRTLGAAPALGRVISAADCEPGAPRVVVLSDRTWREYLGGQPTAVGQAVRLDGAPATVVGVMPPQFTSFMEGRPARAWVPMPLRAGTVPTDIPAGNVIGRLRAGASLDAARGEMEPLQAGLARQFPEFYRDRRVSLRDFREALFGGLGPGIRMLSVIVGLLLLIACANAANLLLGRSLQRVKEVAIRTALGGRRSRLAAGLIFESLILALAASLVGLGLAFWGTQLVWRWTAPIFQAIGVNALPFDQRVVVFTMILTLATTLLFGVVPALRGSRADIGLVLKDAGAAPGVGRRRGRMSRGLVVAQVALCVFTMIGTTLVLRSFLHYLRVSADPGFHPQSLLVATLPLPRDHESDARRQEVVAATASRVAALAGVDRVALVDRVPFLDPGSTARLFKRSASAGTDPGPRLDAELRVADPGFFAVMAVPLLRGRFFTEGDTVQSQPVIVVSDRLARAYWNGGDPIGEQVQVDGVWRTIVGVAGSTVEPSPFRPAAREAFVPVAQVPPSDLKVLVRTSLPAASVAPLVRAAVRSIDAGQPVTDLQTLQQALSQFMTPFRLILVLMALFASIALSLAAVGLYGVMAHGVARRRREIGIRMAIGADRRDVVRMVLREGLRLSAIGLAVGLFLGMALARVLPSEILGVRGLAPLHYVIAALVWLGAGATACLVPARTAASVDPLRALRSE